MLCNQLLCCWGKDLQSEIQKWLLTSQAASAGKEGNSQAHIFSLVLKNLLSHDVLFKLCSDQHHWHTATRKSSLSLAPKALPWNILSNPARTTISGISASTRLGINDLTYNWDIILWMSQFSRPSSSLNLHLHYNYTVLCSKRAPMFLWRDESTESNTLSIINLITQTAWCLHVLLALLAASVHDWESKSHTGNKVVMDQTACPKDLAMGDDVSWQHTPTVLNLLVPEPKQQVSSTGTWGLLNRHVTCSQPHQANRNSTSFLKAPKTNVACQPRY